MSVKVKSKIKFLINSISNLLRHPHYLVLKRTLRGEIEVHSEQMLQALIGWLEICFPEIILDDSDDENQRPPHDTSLVNHPVQEKVQKTPIKRTISTQTNTIDIPQPETSCLMQHDDIITPSPTNCENISFTSPIPLPLELPSSTPVDKFKSLRRNFAIKRTAKLSGPIKGTKEQQKPINQPENPQGSISEYKTKTSVLTPVTVYAKASDKPRTIISVPYKHPIVPKKEFNPKEEAKILKGIKEKIYMKAYLNKKDEKSSKAEMKSHDEKINQNDSKSSNSSEKKKKLRKTCEELLAEQYHVTKGRLRKMKKRVNYHESSSDTSEVYKDAKDEDDSSTEDYSSIPIQKSQSISRRTRNSLKKLRAKRIKRES